MFRCRIFTSFVIFLLFVLYICTVGYDYSAEMIEEHFPEKPVDGIEFNTIDDITTNALDELVKEITEYHYGFSCNEYDTIPLLAPDGEYRALLVLFSLNPELEDSYSYFLDLVKKRVFYAHQWWIEDDEELSAQLKDKTLEYKALLESYYCFVVASVGNDLIPICTSIYRDVDILDSNLFDIKHTFLGFGLLPRINSFYSNCDIQYRVVSITEDEDGNVFWEYVPESLIKRKTWLLYVPNPLFSWKNWVIRSNYWWPLESVNINDLEKDRDITLGEGVNLEEFSYEYTQNWDYDCAWAATAIQDVYMINTARHLYKFDKFTCPYLSCL